MPFRHQLTSIMKNSQYPFKNIPVLNQKETAKISLYAMTLYLNIIIYKDCIHI